MRRQPVLFLQGLAMQGWLSPGSWFSDGHAEASAMTMSAGVGCNVVIVVVVMVLNHDGKDRYIGR